MTRFLASFIGRKIGALGVTSEQLSTVIILRGSADDARTSLYERFEHISKLKLHPIHECAHPVDCSCGYRGAWYEWFSAPEEERSGYMRCPNCGMI